MVKLGRLFTLSLCIFLLSIVVSYPVNAHHLHKVRSAKLMRDKCEEKNVFHKTRDVYAQGKNFPPNSYVDVYVTRNRVWGNGDNLLSRDISSDGVETILTDSNGRFCAMVWGNPLTVGECDIVVDANQSGSYDKRDGDAVDDKSRDPGFKVKRD